MRASLVLGGAKQRHPSPRHSPVSDPPSVLAEGKHREQPAQIVLGFHVLLYGGDRGVEVFDDGCLQLPPPANCGRGADQTSTGRSLKRIEKSTALTSLISAPTEMRSTPVSA